jgi:hypothetical protein
LENIAYEFSVFSPRYGLMPFRKTITGKTTKETCGKEKETGAVLLGVSIFFDKRNHTKKQM